MPEPTTYWPVTKQLNGTPFLRSHTQNALWHLPCIREARHCNADDGPPLPLSNTVVIGTRVRIQTSDLVQEHEWWIDFV